MKNKIYFFNKLVTLMVVLSLSGQSVVFAQAPRQQGLPSSASQLGAAWYVATTGNDDNDCATPSTPCATFFSTINKLANGDRLYVEQGVYKNMFIDIKKPVTISGGWNAEFDAQIGDTIIDHGTQFTIGKQYIVDNETIVSIDHFIIRNAEFTDGIKNGGNLTLTNCEIYNNRGRGISTGNITTINNCNIHDNSGGGIFAYGSTSTTVITNSSIHNNVMKGINDEGGGIFSQGTLTINHSYIYQNTSTDSGGGIIGGYVTINNSAIYENKAANSIGGVSGSGTINNSTISKNQALSGGGVSGGGMNSPLILNNVTVSENYANTGGAFGGGYSILYNSIVANNSALNGNICDPTAALRTIGNNILYKTKCNFWGPMGEVPPSYMDIDPKLGQFIPGVGFAPLASDSPAINAGDPSTCFGTTDQRGAPRVGICDIGAYEYTVAGPPAKIYYVAGDKQRTPPGMPFSTKFTAYAVDTYDTPVGANNAITFSAPASGASGTFASSGLSTETVLTSESGAATSSVFTANSQTGDYTVTASASGALNMATYNVSNGFWAISPNGNDLNNCLSTLTPCTSISGVLAKENFYDGDSVKLLAGYYDAFNVVNLKKSATISGGWDSAFTTQAGLSILKDVFYIYPSSKVVIEKIVIDSTPYDGISNAGTLLFQDGALKNSGGFSNSGILTIKNSTLSGNSKPNSSGGAISNEGQGAKVTVINSTISSNSARQGGAIYNGNSYAPTIIEIYNSTITNNTATYVGSGGIEAWGIVKLSNTIVVGNVSPPLGGAGTFSPDCRGTITSLGYNLIGNIGIFDAYSRSYPCHLTVTGSDILGDNTNPIPASIVLNPLTNINSDIIMYPLRRGSPAIDAGNPLAPGTPNSNACPVTDQRGVTRPQGSRCDIGAYEFAFYSISGNVGTAGVTLSYTVDGTAKTAVSKADGSYSFRVLENWSGTVTPAHTCFTFSPESNSYTLVTANQTDQNYAPTMIPASGCANINVNIGGVNQGTYGLQPQGSTRVNYAGVDNGPVKVVSTNSLPIISAIRDAWAVNGVTTSFSQLMGLPQEQLSDTYVFPGYNNVTLNDQLRIANVDTTATSVTVTIGGTVRGNYQLEGGQAVRINYPGLDSGPVVVQGTSGVKIIAAIREAWAVNGTTTSFVQLMGLPAGQLSNKYVYAAYNNVTLNEQLRIGNVDPTQSTSVTVTIGGTVQGTYPLGPGQAVRVNYPGLDSGPVIVEGTSGVNIISSIRDAWAVGGVTTSFSQLMGMPAGQLSDKYVYPGYNNVTLDDQLRIANVDTTATTVTVTIGGVLKGTYPLAAGAAVRVNYPGLDSGPVVVQGTSGVKIISTIREAWAVNGVTQSFVQLMGLPAQQLSATYWFPAYNNVTLNEQLRIAVP